MLVFEWQTTRFEVVIEQHQSTAPLKVERLPGQILIDLGKFSCAATLYPATLPIGCRTRRAIAASILMASLGFALGLHAQKIAADTSPPTVGALQPYTSG